MKSQGTQLYFIKGGAVVEASCATQVNKAGGTVSAVVSHCLATNTPVVEPGTRGETTLNFDINFDPSETSHQDLDDLFNSDPTEETWFAYGYSDGSSAPTVDSNGEFDFPGTRSFKVFYGFVSDYSESISGNTVVSASLAVTTSGAVLVPASS